MLIKSTSESIKWISRLAAAGAALWLAFTGFAVYAEGAIVRTYYIAA